MHHMTCPVKWTFRGWLGRWGVVGVVVLCSGICVFSGFIRGPARPEGRHITGRLANIDPIDAWEKIDITATISGWLKATSRAELGSS